MNTISAITGNTFKSDTLFVGPVRTSYLWDNLIIEKRVSMNWLDKLYKDSILYDFWTVLSSPIR